MNDTARIAVSLEYLSVYGCLALVWLSFALATYLAHRRFHADNFVRYWSLAWFCAFAQLVGYLINHSIDPAYGEITSKFFMLPLQTVGYLQPAFMMLAAFSIRRAPSHRIHILAFGGCVVAAIATMTAASRMHFTDEADFLRFLITPKAFLLSAANLWLGIAYTYSGKPKVSSYFRYAIPLPCGLQAVHTFLIGFNHMSGGLFYFPATALQAALIGVFLGLWMALALLFDLTNEAQRHSAAKSAFLSTITHELRTPLAGLIGLTSILSGSQLEDEQREVATSIGQCAGSMLALVDDILDVARIEAGQTRMNPAPLAPIALVDEIVSMFRLTAAEKGVRLEAVYENSLPALVCTDAALLKRILLNLVGNALKFTASGSISVRVAYETECMPARLRIAVADDGCGIPAADQPQLMKMFYQASNAVSASSRGTGLGLHLSQQWVTLLGGSGFQVHSELGVGSTFSFAIPAPEARPSPVAVPAAPVISAAATSLLVLVAEDNRVNQTVLVRLLEKLGHRTLIAANGNDAVEQWRCERPDLILMDYRMPGKDGLEATREIRELEHDRGHVPIIAVTANALIEHRDSCLAAGMDDYLSKPVTLQQLAAAIEKWQPPLAECRIRNAPNVTEAG